ncbi:MAG: poly-beta-1,6 N-acetyl-D-glucosamine export porin PgaA [Rhodospirillales bacterium]
MALGASAICLAAAAQAPRADSERAAAVALARGGAVAAGISALEAMRSAFPDDPAVQRDLAVVLTWGGREPEAIVIFDAMWPPQTQEYLLEAIGLAYRRVDAPFEALAFYRRARQLWPLNVEFMAGESRTLVDLGEPRAGEALALQDVARIGENVELLLAAAFAASAQRRPVDALRYIDRAVKFDASSVPARRERIFAIDAMGAPQRALELADREQGLLAAAERRRLEGNVAAALVRWGILEPPSEAARFAATDRAIAMLDMQLATWRAMPVPPEDAIMRARLDRLVALRDRVRMAEVRAEYEDLDRQGAVVPEFALAAAADAYLYLREPEKARPLYARALERDPRNPETRLAMFYAYVELDDFASAYSQVDQAESDQAVWFYLKGLVDPVENPERATAALTAANARLFADELAEANRRIDALAAAAPNNTRFRTALANVYSARGWFRLAAREYRISAALQPRNVANEEAQARNDLAARDYAKVEEPLADLKRRFSENQSVRRLDRLWHVHNLAEFRFEAEQAIRAATNVQGGSGLSLGASVYSRPLATNWRLFASALTAREKLSDSEGAIDLRRTAAGAEYRDPDWVASTEATMSAYSDRASESFGAGLGQGRLGARVLVDRTLDDYLQVGGTAEIFARDTPLRALRNGVTANTASLRGQFRASELRLLGAEIEAMPFSDGNLRLSTAGRAVERLYTRPGFVLDGLAGLAATRNSSDRERPYYNPSADLLATLGLAATQPLYRRYEFLYEHRVTVSPGVYWAAGFGAGPALSVLYEHRIRADDIVEAGLGLSLGRQSYDGIAENNAAVLFNITLRF